MEISTSILNSDNRVDSVVKLNRTNTSYIHVDVMDGKFVSDTQFKINEIKAVNMVSKYPMDIHLMVNDPIKYILEFKEMNIGYITFHLEIRRNKEKIISKIKDMGYRVGISIKPDTDIEKLVPYLKDIDLVLIMSVEPGKGGQKFLDNTVDRINKVKKMIDDGGYNIKIEVDGGINDETISKLQNVDIAVVGSYVIKSDNYYRQIENLLDFDKKDELMKKVKLYKVLLIFGMLPFVILLGFGFYSAVFGLNNIFVGNDLYYSSWGIYAFRDVIFWGVFDGWPLLIISLLLVIVSILKLRKLKDKTKKALG